MRAKKEAMVRGAKRGGGEGKEGGGGCKIRV